MSGKNNKVPNLRFPEFRGVGEWDKKRLGNLSEIVRGGSPRPIDGFLTKDRKGLNWLKIGDVSKNSKYVTRTQERVRIEALSKTREVNPGDLILSNSMSFGRPYILQIKSCIHDGWIAITQIDNKIDRDYLYYLILSPSSQAYFSNNAAGSGVQNLNADIIKSLSVLSPTLPEQQKIAACLSSLDDLITAQTQKLAHLKTHKKGLMQQLFPAEGETVPKLRFPEFRDYWSSLELGECFKNIGGTALEKYVTTEGTHHFISIGNYSTDGKYFDKGQRIEINDVTKSKLLNKNDLVMILNDKTLAGNIIGSTLLIDEDNKYIYNQRSERLIIVSELMPIFSWHLLNSEVVRKEVFKRSQGGTQIYVNFPGIKSIKLAIPKEAKEQQKIADCLSSLDELITAQTQKLAHLKTHKKGLMQQLFPLSEP